MEQIIYLDNAATSFPKPDVVHDASRDFYRRYGVNPGRTGCDLALQAEEMIHNTRKRFSAFFNQSLVDTGKPKDPDRLVFTLNATMSLNLVINGMVGPGDHIVTTKVEHNSVIRPVNHKVREGAEATYVTPDPQGYVDPEDIRKAIRKNTTLVMVNHGSNVTGVVQDLRAIGAVCRDEGVPLAVDAAQTAGVLPIDMAECHISFLSFTGHKCLFGPTGTGGICVADDAEIRGTIYGGTGVRSAHPYHLEEYPYRLEAGTLNLAEIPGVHIWGPRGLEKRVASLSVTVDNYDPSDIGTILDVDFNIQTRTGLHCAPLIHEHMGTSPRGSVRFSIGPFNTEEHIEAAVRAVAETAAERCSSAT
jgi:selenocysteine lyase/cysteine desulfurase